MTKRQSLAFAVAVAVASRARDARAANDLIARVHARDLRKPFVDLTRSTSANAQTYPEWLEGEWRCEASFVGAEFPSRSASRAEVIRERNVPGFLRVSVAYVPDIGAPSVTYRAKFVRDGRGRVEEARGFNLREIENAYAGKEVVDGDVEYDSERDANRTTIRFKFATVPNAERVELFTNARESQTRESDGTFYASETFRQMTLGYSTTYGVARAQPTDYTHVWTYTPVRDASGGGGVNRVDVTLSTAGYLQPNEAMKFTASPRGNGAPIPQIGAASALTFEPVVLYSHVFTYTRVDGVP